MPHPTTPELRAIIRQAMQDRASKMLRRLKAAGLLEREVDDRVAVFEEARDLAIGLVGSPYQKPLAMDGPYPKKVAALTMAANAAQEMALAAALDFPSDEPSTGEPD